MLIVERQLNEIIYIGDDIFIKVLEIHNQKVRLGIQAPTSVPIRRDDIKCKPK